MSTQGQDRIEFETYKELKAARKSVTCLTIKAEKMSNQLLDARNLLSHSLHPHLRECPKKPRAVPSKEEVESMAIELIEQREKVAKLEKQLEKLS